MSRDFNQIYTNPHTILNPEHGFWSVILPEATTNLVTNPSVELGTGGYTAIAGAIARSATWQRRGVYGLAVSPSPAVNDGVYYSITLAANTVHAFSVDVLGAAGVPYQIYIADGSGSPIGTPVTFFGKGLASFAWQRPVVVAQTGAGTSYRLYVTKANNNSTAIFYVDGLQCEAKGYPTTYADGDLVGLLPVQNPPAFYWTGTPHASTSVRTAQTRAGGRVWTFDTLGFKKIMVQQGGGMAPLVHTKNKLGLVGGMRYNRTVYQERQLSLTGVFEGTGLADFERTMSGMIATVVPDITAQKQPLVLRYQPHDKFDPIGRELEMIATYEKGLEGNDTNPLQQQATLYFGLGQPQFRATGETGASLGYVQSVSNANYIMRRDPVSGWSAMAASTGLNGAVRAILPAPDGGIIAAGDFTTADGTSVNYIAKWQNGSWSALGPGLAGTASAVAVGADGAVYVSYFNSGGFSDIYKWDGASWTTLGSSSAGAHIYALLMTSDGRLYAGGDFTTLGGVSATRIAAYYSGAWHAVGSGIGSGAGTVFALAQALDGTLYAGGDFTTAGGSTANNIAFWNGVAWGTLTSGVTGTVRALAVDAGGTIYVAGELTIAGGLPVNRIAFWNGVAWGQMGDGVNNYVYSLAVHPLLNTLLVGGTFTTANGLPLPDCLATYTKGIWGSIDVDLPGSATVNALAVARDGTLYVGYDTGGSAKSAALSVTNGGTAEAHPRFRFIGPGQLYMIRNNTTGTQIIFNNLVLLDGEQTELNLDPTNIYFRGNWRANLLPYVALGSNLANFTLQSGVNVISAFLSGTTGANTAAAVVWQNSYWSLKDAVV